MIINMLTFHFTVFYCCHAIYSLLMGTHKEFLLFKSPGNDIARFHLLRLNARLNKVKESQLHRRAELRVDNINKVPVQPFSNEGFMTMLEYLRLISQQAQSLNSLASDWSSLPLPGL